MTMIDVHSEPVKMPVLRAWGLFAAVNITALSIVAIAIPTAGTLGLTAKSTTLFYLVLAITVCVTVPLSALAAQHKFTVETLQNALRAMAPTDQMTGLLNRRFFELVIRDELRRMDKTGRPSAIAIFEVDHFSRFANLHGRSFGHQVLRQVSRSAHGELRGPFDKLSRWSDEKFIVLLSDVSMPQAEAICDRLRYKVEETPVDYKGERARVTVSFGVAPLMPRSPLDYVIEQADFALHDARRFGRNQVRSRTTSLRNWD